MNNIERHWITTQEAARRADTSLRSMTDWCERYRLGRKVGGRWRINPDTLADFIGGVANESREVRAHVR